MPCGFLSGLKIEAKCKIALVQFSRPRPSVDVDSGKTARRFDRYVSPSRKVGERNAGLFQGGLNIAARLKPCACFNDINTGQKAILTRWLMALRRLWRSHTCSHISQTESGPFLAPGLGFNANKKHLPFNKATRASRLDHTIALQAQIDKPAALPRHTATHPSPPEIIHARSAGAFGPAFCFQTKSEPGRVKKSAAHLSDGVINKEPRLQAPPPAVNR
jgi:hypothetical protein